MLALCLGTSCKAVNTEVGLAFNATSEASTAERRWILTVPTGPSPGNAAGWRRLAALQDEYARSTPEALVLRERGTRDEVAACLARTHEMRSLRRQLEPALSRSTPLVEAVGDDLRDSIEDAQQSLALAEERHASAREAWLAMQDRRTEILALAVRLESASGRQGTATRLRAAMLRLRAFEARVEALVAHVDARLPRHVHDRARRVTSDLDAARAALERSLDSHARGAIASAEIELAALRLLDEEVRGGRMALAFELELFAAGAPELVLD